MTKKLGFDVYVKIAEEAGMSKIEALKFTQSMDDRYDFKKGDYYFRNNGTELCQWCIEVEEAEYEDKNGIVRTKVNVADTILILKHKSTNEESEVHLCQWHAEGYEDEEEIEIVNETIISDSEG